MTTLSPSNRNSIVAACSAVALLAGAGIASAGECPADKVKAGAVMSGPDMPAGVTDTVLASIDLAPKGGDFVGKLFRTRMLTIAPGGIVPWHMHNERPANIYVISGTIEEYRSTCEVPIVHKAGEVTAEFGNDLAHWWKNTSAEPVVLISSDIFTAEQKNDEMM